MTLCEAPERWAARPRRSLVGKVVQLRRPAPKITFTTKREAEIWASIYAEESCHPYHRWEIERFAAVFSAAVYNAETGVFSHWAEP